MPKFKKLSVISVLHFYKLIFRSLLFIAVLVGYILTKVKKIDFSLKTAESIPFILAFIWVIFVAEMILRFFPSRLESMGCQKQFHKNYIPSSGEVKRPSSWRSTLAVALAWLLLNAGVGALYFTGLIDEGILILISLFYSVCDMICILFFCPFQTWFMKNKCCGSCRIYNWDYAMMFTPLVFIPHIYTYSLFGIALLLLLVWEISILVHPERFHEATNECLSCANCKEKLCHHKKQLRRFLKVNKEKLILKGNLIIEKTKKKFSDKKKDGEEDK